MAQAMATASRVSPGLTVGELEAHYPAYCKAMRLLVRNGLPLARVRRTLCWERLSLLNRCLPRQYRDPEWLFLRLRRELQLQQPPITGQP